MVPSSVQPSGFIWRQRSASTLVRVMTCVHDDIKSSFEAMLCVLIAICTISIKLQWNSHQSIFFQSNKCKDNNICKMSAIFAGLNVLRYVIIFLFNGSQLVNHTKIVCMMFTEINIQVWWLEQAYCDSYDWYHNGRYITLSDWGLLYSLPLTHIHNLLYVVCAVSNSHYSLH